jgi:transposase
MNREVHVRICERLGGQFPGATRLWYRRLEKQRLWWPAGTDQGAVELPVRELQWLLEGLDPTTVQGHRKAPFSLL